MPFIEWSDDYNTGVTDIDKEHRALFALVNELHDKAMANYAEGSVRATIEALVDYVDYHFAGEEGIMESCGYRDIEKHKAEHLKLQEQLETYRLSYLNHPESFDITDFIKFLTHWLQNHILITDMAYVPWVQNLVAGVSVTSAPQPPPRPKAREQE